MHIKLGVVIMKRVFTLLLAFALLIGTAPKLFAETPNSDTFFISVSPPQGGTLSHSMFTLTHGVTEALTVTVTVNDGWEFAGWYNIAGVLINSSTSATFNLLIAGNNGIHNDHVFVAQFTPAPEQDNYEERYQHNLRLINSRPFNSEMLAFLLIPSNSGNVLWSDIRNLTDSIVSGLTQESAKAKAIYDWVTESVYYNQSTTITGRDTNIARVYRERTGTSWNYAILTTALLRAANIPSRTVVGEVYEGNAWGVHYWNEAYVGARWIVMDTVMGSGNRFVNGVSVNGTRNDKFYNTSINDFSITHKFSEDYDFNIFSADYDFTGFDVITIPNGVTSIGYQMFFEYAGLTRVNIPASVISISEAAFYNLPNLTSVVIPINTTNIGYGRQAFWTCPNLTIYGVAASRAESHAREYNIPFATGEPPEIVTEEFTITISASPENGGEVTGGGNFESGETAALSAMAYSGWEFTGWYVSNELVSTNSTTVITVIEDITVEARFTEIPETTPEPSPDPTPDPTPSPTPTPAYSEVVIEIIIDNPVAKVNGFDVTLDQSATILNGRTVVPARFIAENLGATVSWVELNQMITIMRGNITIMIQIDNPIALVNGIEIMLEQSATILNNRTVVPARFIAENLGATEGWEEWTRKATIVGRVPLLQ